jgi:transcriptional regulator GlxA family with amidase domain
MLQNVRHEDVVIREQQAWIGDNYDRANIVAELVRRSGLPERSFARRFKAATGYTPIAYVQALRIEEAKQNLERTRVAVEDIAREVGYEDVAHFRRLFRRLTGMPPGSYRRQFAWPRDVQVKAE